MYGHAVAFPAVGADRLGPLPAEVSPRIVLFGEDLAAPRHARAGDPRVLGRAAARPPALLDERQFAQFRKHVLLPRWRLAPTFGARLELESQAIVRLSDEQVEVLRSLVSAPRLCVRGGAGSGKTLLALELARAAALEGRQRPADLLQHRPRAVDRRNRRLLGPARGARPGRRPSTTSAAKPRRPSATSRRRRRAATRRPPAVYWNELLPEQTPRGARGWPARRATTP